MWLIKLDGKIKESFRCESYVEMIIQSIGSMRLTDPGQWLTKVWVGGDGAAMATRTHTHSV